MKRTLAFFLAAVMTALVLCSCGNPDEFSDGERLSGQYSRKKSAEETFNYKDGAIEPPQSYSSFVTEVTAHTLGYYKAREKQSADSAFAFSPAAAMLMLGAVEGGASGETAQELQVMLGGNSDSAKTCSSYFKSRMESVSGLGLKKDEAPSQYISLGGALFFDDGVNLKSAFLQANADYYGFDVFSSDLSSGGSDVKIKNYLSLDEAPAVSDDGFYSVVTSAVSDNWLEPYSGSGKTAAFKGTGGEREMTFYTADEWTVKSDRATGIVKSTEKNPLKLILIMPNTDVSIGDYIAGLDSKEYTKLLDSTDITKKTPAAVPAFSIEADKAAVSVSSALNDGCRLYSVFSDNADYEAMSFEEGLLFKDMYEASPAIYYGAGGINADIQAQFSENTEKLDADGALVFDRPFIFILADNETSIPVIMGVYR